MPSISISTPDDNDLPFPATLEGRYSLQSLALAPARMAGGSSSTNLPPIITITLKKESDNSTKDYTSGVTPDTDGSGSPLLTGGWALTKPGDVVQGESYTVIAKLNGAQATRLGIQA